MIGPDPGGGSCSLAWRGGQRRRHFPAVTQTQVHLFTVLNWGLLIGDAVVGLLILRGRWHRATTPDRQDPTVPDRPHSAADIAPVSAEAKRK